MQGSKAVLAKSRLEMAKASVKQVSEILAKLPAADAQVATIKKRIDAATAGIAALEARLGGKSATTPASGEVKLDFKQEQLAKDARSYLDEIAGLAAGAKEVIAKAESLKDQLTIDHRLVQSAANAIAKGRQRAGLVKGRLDQLPANGMGVAALTAQYKELVASLDASDAVIAPLHKKLSALVDPAAYLPLEKVR